MGNKYATKPKALILEARDDTRQYVEKILTLAGWKTVSIKNAAETTNVLKKDISNPFALFICNYDQSITQDDTLLKKVRRISPITQRLIMVSQDHSHRLIRVVNQVGIRACITVPFTPKVLVNQVRSCLEYFSKILKRERMSRIIAHQNRQLYRSAKKMEEKETALTRLIQEKTFQTQVLERVDAQGQCSLRERFVYHNIPMTPEHFSMERSCLENEIIRLFEQAAGEMQLQMPEKKPPLSSPEKNPDPQLSEKAEKIVRTVLGSEPSFRRFSQEQDGDGTLPGKLDDIENTSPLDSFFQVRISKDQLIGSIRKSDKIHTMADRVSPPQILEFLRTKRISYGIVPEQTIASWLETAGINEPLQVAEGTPPLPGQDGKVTCHFENMTMQAGKIHADGSIDFKERRHIPHVFKGDLLAEKIPPVPGSDGVSVSGTPISVPDVIDPGFGITSNAHFSEDGLSIFASTDGEPHVDTLGRISVNPAIEINGDVGYETGNLDFEGNVVVKGSIQTGFSVRCMNLTVESIQGARISVTGDLNVAAGITESKVRAVGQIKAKFVNRSSVFTFSDMTVQKEILDSQIFLGGTCNNAAGHIIASKVVARGGIEACRIGTDTSGPCTIGVGGNDLAIHVRTTIKKKIQKIQTQYQSVQKTINEMETKAQELYPAIIRKTQSHESIGTLFNDAKNNLIQANISGDAQSTSRLGQKVKELRQKKDAVEKQLDQLFGLQDSYLQGIEDLKQFGDVLKGKENKFMVRLQEIAQFEKNTPVVPNLLVNRSITQKTAVKGTSSSLILDKAQHACRIKEVVKKKSVGEGVSFYMDINGL